MGQRMSSVGSTFVLRIRALIDFFRSHLMLFEDSKSTDMTYDIHDTGRKTVITYIWYVEANLEL